MRLTRRGLLLHFAMYDSVVPAVGSPRCSSMDRVQGGEGRASYPRNLRMWLVVLQFACDAVPLLGG